MLTAQCDHPSSLPLAADVLSVPAQQNGPTQPQNVRQMVQNHTGHWCMGHQSSMPTTTCAATCFPVSSGGMWQTGPVCRAAGLDGNATLLCLLLLSS